MRCKSQIPAEAIWGKYLSCRQGYFAKGLCKGGDHERGNQSSNQARITSAPAPAVSRGSDGQEEE